MAIKKTVKAVFGIDVNDAYHRVTSISIVSKDKMHFHVESSVDGKNAAFEDKMHACEYVISGENPIAQAYAHLKSLDEFVDAVDC